MKYKHIRKQNQRIQQIPKLAQYEGIGQINTKYSNPRSSGMEPFLNLPH